MRRYTGIKVIAVFVITVAIVSSAYWMTSISLKEIVQAVREFSQPNLVLIQVKEINSDILAAEISVRAFIITQDEKYLQPYQKLVGTIDKKLDSLHLLTKDKEYVTPYVNSISPLMKEKLEVLDELLGISYNKVLQSVLGKITSHFPDGDSLIIDTLKIPEEKKSFIKKIFSSPSREALKEKAESAQKENEINKKQIANVKKTMAEIEEQEIQQLKRQTEKELALLGKDKLLSEQIENVIRRIEFVESEHFQQKAETANSSAEKSGRNIQWLIISGAVLILLLIFLILYDITKSNLYRKQLADAKLKAEKLTKIKEEFLASMSHEIRTPLSAILGYTSRLQKTNLNDRQTNYVNTISNSSEHLLSIVNDILDLTKTETGNLRFEKINFKPADIMHEVYETMKMKAEEKNLQLIVDTKIIKDIAVKGDPLRLKQILFNLTGNAIKFTDRGFVKLEVENLKSEKNESPNKTISNFEFRISDSGMGIPEEKLKTIFTQFSQVDSSISRKFGGSGLGLNISKKIIELQGGTIEVSSKIMKGSEFIVTIPYEIVDTQESATTNHVKIKSEAEKSLSGINILLAEDVEINRLLQVEMLKDFGAKVIAVSNGVEAISALRKQDFQLVLMDVQMPEMNGMEAVKEIRQRLKSNVPILAMTANVMQHDLEIYLQNGFNDYITKPFKEKELAEKILSALHGNPFHVTIQEQEEEIINADKLYDLNDLKNTSNGNNDFVIRMLKIFLSSAESLLNKAVKNVEERNWEALSSNVHRLIPSCRHLSIYSMSVPLKKIENICSSNPDETIITELLHTVLKEFEKISFSLGEEIGNLKSEHNV